jgi:hypothetical protein
MGLAAIAWGWAGLEMGPLGLRLTWQSFALTWQLLLVTCAFAGVFLSTLLPLLLILAAGAGIMVVGFLKHACFKALLVFLGLGWSLLQCPRECS